MKHMLVYNSCGRESSLFEPFLERFAAEWNLDHIVECHEVLKRVDEEQIDVVVAVIDKQPTDALELFSNLKKVSPKTIRFVMTSQANERRIANSLELITSYISIDASVSEFASQLTRSVLMAENLDANSFFNANGILDRLPSIPSVYNELIDLFNDQEPSIKEVSALIKQDSAMTAKLIQLVNSSFFGLRRVIVSVEDAAVMIGLEPIKALVLSNQIFRLFENRRVPVSYLKQLWTHSTLTAAFARCIARCESNDRGLADIAFTAGMLHDIGKLIMLEHLPEEYLEYASILTENTYESHEVERLIFGTTHSNMGAFLLHKWGFPDNLLEPIMFHHKPLWLHDKFNALHAVFAADCFYHEFYVEGDDSARLGGIHVDCRSVLDRANYWKEACHSLIT